MSMSSGNSKAKKMVCYLIICVCCFRTTAHYHSWCGSRVFCYANLNYARNLCSVCNTKCPGYCVKPPTFVKRYLVKTFWQLYKKPCSQLATHNKLKYLLEDFDNSDLYHVFEKYL